MNLIIAFVLMAVVMLGFGVPTTTATLGTVSQCVIPADEPADRTCTATDEPAPGAAAGLLPGTPWSVTTASPWRRGTSSRV